MEIENVTSKKTFIGEFDTREELQAWYMRCVARSSFGPGEIRSGEVVDLSEEYEEEKKLRKKQDCIYKGAKLITKIGRALDKMEHEDAFVLVKKYDAALRYLQYGFLDLASMEIAKVSTQDDNGLEARLKKKLLKEITDYNARA